jgi:hypothetical protein
LFLSESITATTPNGKIFVMGGQFQNQHKANTYYLVPQLKSHQVDQFNMQKSQPFEEYVHLAAPDREEKASFFETYMVRSMLGPKSSFGHFPTNYQIFIAGGSNEHNFSLNQVESYDIKKDIWIKQPDLNIDRRSPSICLFRTKFLYVFGGTQLKKKADT